MKKTVLIVPGVMGTELFRNNAHRIWPPSVTKFEKDFEYTYLDESGSPMHGDIKAGMPFRNVYRKMYDFLASRGFDVHYFGYDWRLDISQIAAHLETWMEGLNEGAVSIVAHSMGGLVTTRYLKQALSPRVEKFVAIGTPFLGAVGALKDLELGTFMGDGFTGQISKNYFKKLLRNQISWYQILPTRKFFEIQREGYIERIVTEGKTATVSRIKGFDESENFIKSRDFVNAKSLAASTEFGDRLDLFDTLSKTEPWFISGTGHPTMDRISYFFDKTETGEVFDKLTFTTTDRGDGSVLEASATIGDEAERRFPGHVHAYAETHGGLFCSTAVFEKIETILGPAG